MLHTYMEMEYIAIVALKNIFYTHEKKIKYVLRILAENQMNMGL